MSKHRKKYKALSAQERKELETVFKEIVKQEFGRGKLVNGQHCYKAAICSMHFIAEMTDEELEYSIKLAFDLLEELRRINNAGLNKAALEQIVAAAKAECKDGKTRIARIWNQMATDQLTDLADKIADKAGTKQVLYSMIYAVFCKIIDSFDEDEIYCQSIYFFIRTNMMLHSMRNKAECAEKQAHREEKRDSSC